MNKIYRLIKNRVSGTVQVAPETARGQGKNLRKAGAALAAALTYAMPGACAAAYTPWTANTDNWFTPSNWGTAAVPTASDTVVINNGGTAQVASAGAVAFVTYVGENGTGALSISNGGTLNAGGGIGAQVGSSGAVTVDGAGSRWSSSTGDMFVGSSGSGMLYISNGGAVVSSAWGIIGHQTSGSGAVTVDGAGSSWSNGGDLYVGYFGSGTLSISNGGAVNGAVNGTVTLGNSASGSGTLNIGDGDAAGILNAARVNGGAGTATLNFNHTDSAYTFTNDGTSGGSAIAINGSTAVNHIGSGTTILTGTNTYTGGTTIDAGTLLVNGSIVGDTYVNNGGTLGGSGTLGKVTVASGGTLSPGNSPGILAVAGDLTLAAGSTTVMEIDGPVSGTGYDQINVSGIATLAGTLDLQFSYAPAAGASFNLINASSFVLAGDPQTGFNPIIDNFSSNLGAALRVTPVITDTEYDILIQQLSFIDAAGGNLTPNQRSVAANLDSFSASGNGATLFGALNMLPAYGLGGAYDSLSGAQHTHTLPQVARVTRQFRHFLGDHLSLEPSALNTAASRFDKINLAYNGEGLASLFGAPVAAKPDSNLWLRAMAGFGDIDSDGNATGADYSSGGVALGYDREVRDGLLAGVAFGFTRSKVDMSAGNTDIESYQLAAYGRKHWENNYLDATLGIGHHRADSARHIQFDGFSEVAHAGYDSKSVGLSLEAGRHYALSADSRVTPFAGLEYGHSRSEGYRETDAGDANLTFADYSMDSLRSVMGARFNNALTTAGGNRIDTTLGLAWTHEFMDTKAILNPAFTVNSLVPFNVSGPATSRDRIMANLGASARLSKTAQLDLDYRGEFAESEGQHAISAKFRMTW